MDAAQIGALVVAGGSALGVLLAYFKFKPGQRERVEVETAAGELNIAEGSVRLVQSTLHGEFIRMAARIEELEKEAADDRREFTQYRRDNEARIAELAAELRAEKAEKRLVQQENERLHARVAVLEAEVARLTGERQ